MIRIGCDALRRIAAIAFAAVIAGCGGGGGGITTPDLLPQTANGVTITEGSGIVAASLGDEQQQIFALPGEVTQRTLRVQRNDRSLLLDIAVTRGAEAVSVREESGRLLVTVNSTTLRAGDAIPYTVTVRNRATGTGAEVNGTVQVLTPTTVASGQVTEAGGVIENRAAKVRIEFDPRPGAVPLNVAVNIVDQSDGRREIRIVFDRDISSDDRVIRISPPSSFASSPQARISSTGRERIAGVSTLPLHVSYPGLFTLFGDFRFGAGPLRLAAMAASCIASPVELVLYVCYSERPAAELRGSQQSVGEPVLFVHGFNANLLWIDSLGGGDDTWGNFFSLVRLLNAVPFEFQWRTNARFQTVADDLAAAILAIRANSGDRKITVVAHSFGGVLVRSLLQHLGTDKNTDWSQHIRQVVTLGAPHSGIFDSTTQSGLFAFPNGQDNIAFERCDQISCHQMGEDVFSFLPASLQLIALTGVNSAPGEVAAMLANLDANALPPGVPFSVGIGLAMDVRLSLLNNIVGTIYRNGDALISLQGQRFTPRLLGSTGDWNGDLAYLRCATVFGPHVEEIVLGSDGRFPGQSLDLPVIQNGYGHNNYSVGLAGANLSANLQEANVGCTTTGCGHASFQLVRRALEHGVCYPTITRGPETVFTDNGTALFTVTASGNPPLTYQWRINGVDIVVDGNGRSTQCGTGFLAAGINTATLSLTGLPAGCSSTNFTVVVGSGPLLKTSAIATLFVGVPPPPAADCGGQAVSWTQGTLTCDASYAGGRSGTSSLLSDVTAPTTGTATASCTNGVLNVTSPMCSTAPSPPATLVAPTPLAPTGTITTLTPVFSWSGGSGAANYEISVRDLTTATIVLRQQGISTGSTSFTMPAGTLVNARQYRWDITACPNFACSSDYVTSGNLTFTTQVAASQTVTSVSVVPSMPTAGTQATFSVNGTNLQPGYVFSLPGCAATEVASVSTTLRQFTCTPTLSGTNLSGTVSTAAGTVLYAFVQTVGAGGVLPLQRRGIATGLFHSCALTSVGGVKCWGSNSNSTLSAGQLGDGTSLNRLVPVDVVGLSSGVVAVSAGAFHTCALTTAGGVKCWGQNFGALGDGTEQHSLIPVNVVGLGSGVVAISAGGGHTCALTSTGGVKCWGVMGGYGLGDGTTQDWLEPVDVVGLTGGGAVAIAVGNTHTCAITSAGGVKCWGGNGGRLGDGTDQDSLIPVNVLGLGSGVVAITAGGTQSCALTNAGGIKCWGINVSGALGDNTTVNRREPVDVTGLTSGVVAVSAGGNHTCAVTSSGGVKCWGSGLTGQLGDGAFNVDRLTAVDVTGLSNGVTAVSAGGQHTCARTSTGSVKCWGFNGLGGLGDGTTNSRAVPLDVVGFQPAGSNPFMGSYAGSYAGGQIGTWAASINDDGTISAAATGGFAGTGSVTSAGITTIALGGTGAAEGFTITFSGSFALQSNGTMTGSGTWTSSSGLTGTWAGARIN